MSAITKTIKQKTIDYYDQQAKKWAEEHGGEKVDSYRLKYILKFNKLLPQGKILEIGSGDGKDARELIKLGYEYVGTDASKELIKIASLTNPGAILVNQSVDQLDFPAETFDGFWAAAVLLHIPKAEMDEALLKIKSVCKKGAVGFISLKIGKGEKEQVSTGRWFAYYTEGEIRGVLKKNGYELLKMEFDYDIHGRDKGKNPSWMCIYVKV